MAGRGYECKLHNKVRKYLDEVKYSLSLSIKFLGSHYTLKSDTSKIWSISFTRKSELHEYYVLVDSSSGNFSDMCGQACEICNMLRTMLLLLGWLAL